MTEGEIVAAIQSPVGARSYDGIKRRTWLGTGRCQGGFDYPRVIEILSRELGVAPTNGFPNSQILPGESVRAVVPQRLNLPCAKSVRIAVRVSDLFELPVVVQIMDSRGSLVYEWHEPYARPAEMLVKDIPAEIFRQVDINGNWVVSVRVE